MVSGLSACSVSRYARRFNCSLTNYCPFLMLLRIPSLLTNRINARRISRYSWRKKRGPNSAITFQIHILIARDDLRCNDTYIYINEKSRFTTSTFDVYQSVTQKTVFFLCGIRNHAISFLSFCISATHRGDFPKMFKEFNVLSRCSTRCFRFGEFFFYKFN